MIDDMLPSVRNCKTAFEHVRRQRQRREPLQFNDVRWDAFDRFLSLGFPTTRDDGWRLTDITPIADTIFTMGAKPADWTEAVRLAPFHLADVFGAELVFVNGHYVPEASTPAILPSGPLVEPLSAVLHENPEYIDTWLTHVAPLQRPAFVAMNTGLFTDGACVLVPARTVVEKPIHVKFISTGEADSRPAMSQTRVLVVLEPASQATIVESYAGVDGVQYFTNAVAEIALGEDAILDHYKLQHESRQAYHIDATYAVAARGARCSVHSINLGGALVRNDVVALLGGEDGECALNGLYLGDRQQLVDYHTIVDHTKPRCKSRQAYGGILGEEARGVFDAKLIVGSDATKTDAGQINRSLLLSDEARVDSTSRVDMSANDVNCKQRSVVRQLSDEVALYRRSHDIEPTEARHVVARAFASEVVTRLHLRPLRDCVHEIIHRHLDRLLGSGA